MQGRIFRWKTTTEQFQYYDSGKYSAPYMSNVSGTSYYNRFVLATEATNLPLMEKGRAKGWIKGDPNIFYRDEAQRVTSLATKEFAGNTSLLTFIEFEHFSIATIPDQCFSGCTALKEIIYPKALKSTGTWGVFDKCYKLTALPDMTHFSVAKYGNTDNSGSYANSCSSLTEIHFATATSYYARGSFGHNTGIKEITIPSGATEIRYQAFVYCKLHKIIFYDGGNLVIGSSSFYFESGVPHTIICERTVRPTLDGGAHSATFGYAQNTTIYYPAGSDYSHWMTFAYSGLKDNCRFIPCQRGEDGHLIIPEEN